MQNSHRHTLVGGSFGSPGPARCSPFGLAISLREMIKSNAYGVSSGVMVDTMVDTAHKLISKEYYNRLACQFGPASPTAETKEALRIFILSDVRLCREGLALLLARQQDIEVVGSAPAPISKIGIGDDSRLHDAGIVERTLGGVTSRYFVVALGSDNDFAHLSKIFVMVNTALS